MNKIPARKSIAESGTFFSINSYHFALQDGGLYTY